MDTENRIGNFLKNVRCTGKSVELHDVLAYLNEEMKTQINILQEVPSNDNVNTQNAIINWNSFEPDTFTKDNLQVMEVVRSIY